MAKLLIVEDDPRIVSFLERGLSSEGHAVEVARTGEEALALIERGEHALIVLDRMLPDMDGATVCQRAREMRRHCRILMLTAKDAVTDRIEGLKAGADDYLTKPFSFDELVLRIEALLRRGEIVRHEPVLAVADLTLNTMTRAVSRAGRAISLTPKEYALLRYLMENEGTVLSRAQILSNNWGYSFDPGTKVVDVYVRYLRRKIGAQYFQTVRGRGYRLA